MNRLTLIQSNECPPDQYRYRFREDGYLVKCFSYGGWLERIRAHRQMNGYPESDDWKEEAEDQLCRLLPPGWCRQVTGEPPEWYINSRIGIEDVLRGTRVLAAFVADGMPLVSRTVAAERASICSTCPFASSVEGCSICVGLSNVVEEVVGGQQLQTDAVLDNKSCLVCKCSARAQPWVPVEYLSRGVTNEMLAQFPTDYCWKRKEILEFRKSNEY